MCTKATVIGWCLGLTICGTLQLFAQSVNLMHEFEVASIKRANPKDCEARQPIKPMPARLEIPCASTRALVRVAYGGFDNFSSLHVLGGAGWLDKDKFTILAKAPTRASISEMCGPMLKALLEDRFELKAHQETRETAVFELRQSKGGAKLRPSAAGSCTPMDLDNLPSDPTALKKICGMGGETYSGGLVTAVWNGVTMAELTDRMLARYVDRSVIDKTGLTERFDIRLVFATDRLTAVPAGLLDSPAGPTLIDALKDQLNLTLVSARGPQKVIVIDHVVKPDPN